MAGKRAGTLGVLMERVEAFTLHRAWTQLSDEEFFWEPAAGAWGIRRREECRTPTPFGNGEWVADFDHDLAGAANAAAGEVEPMTTIGWILWHIGSMPGRLAQMDFFGGGRTLASGWASPYLSHHPVFTSASEATETLQAGWSELKAVLEKADDQRMEQRIARYTYAREPPREGLAVLGPPGPEVPAYFSVASTLNEISHHGTQVCVLRDLYRWTR